MDSYRLKTNGYFAIIDEPIPHKQHQNQQGGLDIYIKVLNISTGVKCFLKLYENTKGLHFKMNGSHYLDEFTKECVYVPYQLYIDGMNYA